MRRDTEETFEPARLIATCPWPKQWSACGVIEVLGPMVTNERLARLEGVLSRRLSSVTVLLDSPHDPHNGAAVLRSCDAFGVQEAHVIPAAERFLASNMVAKGAERWVDVIEHVDSDSAAGALKGRGFRLVATHPQGRLTPEDLAQVPKVALVLGNERDGISQPLTALMDDSVRIPMVGFVESLNVSVSTAILLRAATQGRPGDLDPSSKLQLLARGLVHTVPRAPEILAALAPR